MCMCGYIPRKADRKRRLLWFLEHNGFATVKDIEKTAPDEFELEQFEACCDKKAGTKKEKGSVPA